MTAASLVFVRSVEVVDLRAAPTCTAYWSDADWARLTRRHVEPLVLEPAVDFLRRPWVATGDRDARGRLLYRLAE